MERHKGRRSEEEVRSRACRDNRANITIILASLLGSFLGFLLGRRIAETNIDRTLPSASESYKMMTDNTYGGPIASQRDIIDGPLMHPYVTNFE
jgi:hypothetical protein